MDCIINYDRSGASGAIEFAQIARSISRVGTAHQQRSAIRHEHIYWFAICVVAVLLSLPVAAQTANDPSTNLAEARSQLWSSMPLTNTEPEVHPSALCPTSGCVDVASKEAGESSEGKSPNPTPPPKPPNRESRTDSHFKWFVSTQESLLFTGIMHAYNLSTEAGTRDALNGPWLNQYMQSVSELRGWSDSDTFMAPYVGHTIEGAVFGYIQRQNDPKYRRVQWGDGREYFHSILRSLAYSAVWHTQWKIGPISEASIGNVMLHASPGFITLVDTPTLGTVAMIAEDAADRYLIMGLENRTSNPELLALTRSFLNPGRSFANVMAFRHPWHRETRMGLFGENHTLRKELLAQYKANGERPFEYYGPSRPAGEATRSYPKEAPIELAAFPLYESLGGRNCVGGGGSGAARVNARVQVVAEVSGCLVMGMPSSNQSGDSLFYGGGFRWTPRAAHSISPYAQLMFGGRKVTQETVDHELHDKLFAQWNDGKHTTSHYPKRSDYSVLLANNGPALSVGAGLDYVVTRAFAWRLLNIEYSHTWIEDVAMIQPQNSLRVSMGTVLRIGTW